MARCQLEGQKAPGGACAPPGSRTQWREKPTGCFWGSGHIANTRLLLVFLFPAVNGFRKDSPYHKKYTSDYGAQENMYDNKRLRHERFEIMVQRSLGRQEDPANNYCHNRDLPLTKEPIQPAASQFHRQLFCQPVSKQEMKQRPNAGADQSQYQRIHDIPANEFFYCFRKSLSPAPILHICRCGYRYFFYLTIPPVPRV